MLSFSCVFAGWTRLHCCVLQISCIQCTALYPVSCRTFRTLRTLACRSYCHLVLFSISNVQEAVLCLPRFWASLSVVLSTSPSHMCLPSGVEEDSDSAFLPTRNYIEKSYFICDVLEPNCLPQGLDPPVKPAANPAPKAAKPRAKPQPRVRRNLLPKMAAKPAAGESILVAPVEHVQLSKVKSSC